MLKGGEAVLDNQTGLIWARNADMANGTIPWQEAMNLCQNLEIGNRKGWRLPTKEEFITILDTSRSNPALPDGHPFKNINRGTGGCGWNNCLTGTTIEGHSDRAYYIWLNLGRVCAELKIFDDNIWPVLGSD